jgi:glycyl-tRNA synthetase alpha subunit
VGLAEKHCSNYAGQALKRKAPMTPEQAQEQLKVLDDNFALLLHERMLQASHALIATTMPESSSTEDRDEWLKTIAKISRLTAVLAHQEARFAILGQVEGIDETQDEAAQ